MPDHMTDSIEHPLLTAIRERCAVDGQHWIWRLAVNSSGMPTMHHDGKGCMVRRLVLQARYGRAPANTIIAVATCDHALCVSPHCVDGVSLANARRLAAQRGAYQGNVLRHLRATMTARARSRFDEVAVARMRDASEPAAVVAAEIGAHPSYVHYVRRGMCRRDLTTPWTGLQRPAP